jgi:hypothetical protein
MKKFHELMKTLPRYGASNSHMKSNESDDIDLNVDLSYYVKKLVTITAMFRPRGLDTVCFWIPSLFFFFIIR